MDTVFVIVYNNVFNQINHVLIEQFVEVVKINPLLFHFDELNNKKNDSGERYENYNKKFRSIILHSEKSEWRIECNGL